MAGENATSLDLKCPKCDGTLQETQYENIKIDVCDKCTGVWLDAGELAQVVDKDKSGGWFSRLLG
jgi:Zn-finger nucleic acid-binding protein